MRQFLLAGFIALAATQALADRIIFLPAGRKLASNSARLEILTTPSRDNAYGWLTYSPNKTFEFELSGENLNTDNLVLGFNGSYTYTNPVTDIAPGISFGFIDAFNNTKDGRALYAALTYRLGNDGELNQFLPTELSFGIWSKESSLFYVGAEFPFSETLKVMAEFDAKTITAGAQITMFEGASFRILFRDGDPTFGLRISKRF